MTLVLTHPVMLRHRPPEGHPERPERLASVLAALAPLGLPLRDAPVASRESLARVHDAALLDRLAARAPADDAAGPAPIDPDTFLSAAGLEAAARAAGAVCAGVDAVQAGEIETVFCAVRPPGHHAEPDRAMGFCLYNSIAVGALHALEAHGLRRVAVVDFDVHHGNGTQAVADREPRLWFFSTHQSPLYPGTGRPDETGPAGNVFNAPLPPGAEGPRFRAAMEATVLPALAAAAPELILVSAGFDAHREDPLAHLLLDDEDFAWVGARLRAVARQVCGGRIVSSLEGGYDLAALGRAARAFVDGLSA